jgi:hypothetical protein
MTTQEFFRRLSQSDAWQQLGPATHTKYLFWFRHYMEFLRQNPVEDLSTQQKIMQFLLQCLMENSAHTKRQAVAALTWLYKHILHEEFSPPRVQKTSKTFHLSSTSKRWRSNSQNSRSAISSWGGYSTAPVSRSVKPSH